MTTRTRKPAAATPAKAPAPAAKAPGKAPAAKNAPAAKTTAGQAAPATPADKPSWGQKYGAGSGHTAGQWTKGTVDKDGFEVVWPHGFYALLKRPVAGSRKVEWIAEMSDGHRIPGANVQEVEAAARAYGKEHGLVRKGNKGESAAS